MKNHEWHEHDTEAGETRYFRAGKFGKRWIFHTTLKSDEEWTQLDPIPKDMLEVLRDVLFRKYQRRRVPWEDIVAMDKLIAGDDEPDTVSKS